MHDHVDCLMHCQAEIIDGVLTCRACGVPFQISERTRAQIGEDYARLYRRCAAERLAAGEWRVEEESGGIQNPPAPGPQPVPSWPRRAINFSKAAIGHVRRGMPTCTQEQIDARLVICQRCELYQVNPKSPTDSGTCTHRSCGCPVRRAAVFRNKLAWADQGCPLSKWPQIHAAH